MPPPSKTLMYFQRNWAFQFPNCSDLRLTQPPANPAKSHLGFANASSITALVIEYSSF